MTRDSDNEGRLLLVEGGDWRVMELSVRRPLARGGSLEASLNRLGSRLKAALRLRSVPIQARSTLGATELRISGIAGIIGFQGMSIDVAPKFVAGRHESDIWKIALLRLIKESRQKHVAFMKAEDLSAARNGFVDLLAMSFLDAVRAGLADQPIQVYRTEEVESEVLRGRINIARQIHSLSMLKPHLLQCDVDSLNRTNSYNALLKWAALELASTVTNPLLRRQLNEISHSFPCRPDRQLALQRRNVSPPPQFFNWAPALEIAQLVSSGMAEASVQGQRSGYTFVFNMEQLFERFVESTLRLALADVSSGFRCERQVRSRYAIPSDPGQRAFYSRPDNVVSDSAGPMMVVDAKYKRLSDISGLRERKPQNQDVYELVAAMTAQGCRTGLLVYPKIFGDDVLVDGQLRTWTVDSFGARLRVGAVAIDLLALSDQGGAKAIQRSLADALNQLI